ncbi:hypothetical protein GW17_00041526, partial [Ensete ventricosum]
MALDIVLIAGILLGFVVHLLLRRRFQSIRRLRLPPGPSGVPILGALPQIGPMPHASLANLAARYGPIMYLRMGTTGVVVASSAGGARSFLKALD